LIPSYGAVGAAIAGSAAIIIRNVLNQAGLVATTRAGIAPRRAKVLYGTIVFATVALFALRWATDSLFVLVPAVAAASLILPWVNRRYLDIANTYPEIRKLPFMRRFFGKQELGAETP